MKTISFGNNNFEAELIAKLDAVADQARIAVAGDGIRIKEYEFALADAVAFKDAGYTGPAGPGVTSWSNATGWTEKEAADDIMAANARWVAALMGIRTMRLQAKQDIARATTGPAKKAIFDGFVRTLTQMMHGVV